MPLSENVRIGLAGGFSGGQLRGAGVTTNVRSWFIGPYGSLRLGPVILDGDLFYTYSRGDMKANEGENIPLVSANSRQMAAKQSAARMMRMVRNIVLYLPSSQFFYKLAQSRHFFGNGDHLRAMFKAFAAASAPRRLAQFRNARHNNDDGCCLDFRQIAKQAVYARNAHIRVDFCVRSQHVRNG